MSDPSVSAAPDLGQMILQAPEPLWKKIKRELKVQTREQAASLVQTDAKAQEAVVGILSSQSAATSKTQPRTSAATSTRAPEAVKRPQAARKSGVQF